MLVTAAMSSIDESVEGEGMPSDQRDDALAREVKVNLASLHRKIDIMAAQVNRKLDAIMPWHDGGNNCMPNDIACVPSGIFNGKEWYKQSIAMKPGAMSGKYKPEPPLPPPAASYLRADVEEVDKPNKMNRLMSFTSYTSQLSASFRQSVATHGQNSRSSKDDEKHKRGKNVRPSISGGKASMRSDAQPKLTTFTTAGFSKILESGKNRRLKWHQRVLNFLDEPDSSRAAFVYSKVVSTAILASCVLNFTQTIKPPLLNPDIFVPIEMLCDAFFLGEVSVRFLATPNKIGFFSSYHNCIDVLSSGPALTLRALTQYTPFRSNDAAEDIRYVVLCISPVFRMLKMLRRWNNFNLLMYSGISLVSEVMPILLIILFILTFTFSSLIYFVEPRDNIDALPKAFWFTIITMSTVGYGDVVPSTTAGNVITLVLVISSALYMAVPLGIAGNAFSKVWDNRDWLLLIQYMHNRLTVNNYKATDIPNLFLTFGNDNGEIALDEFVRMISEMELGIREDRILDLFFSFDSDNSGTIDSMEFIKVIFPSEFVQMYGGRRSARKSAQSSQGDNIRSTKGAERRSKGREVSKNRETSFNSIGSSTHNAKMLDGGYGTPHENQVLIGAAEKKETESFFA